MTTEHEETGKLLTITPSFVGFQIGGFETMEEATQFLDLLDEKTETIRSQDEKIKELEHAIKLWKEEEIIWEEGDLDRYEKIRLLREALESIPHEVDICGPKKCSPVCSACRIDKVLQEISDTKEVG